MPVTILSALEKENIFIWTEEGRELCEDNIEKCLEVHWELIVN